MDNRTGRRDNRPERYVSDVGTDTVPVNLVELRSVGSRKRSSMPLFLVSLAVVGLVAFALGGALSTPPPQPSATAAPVAIASPSAVSTAMASLSPRPSPRQTQNARPTPGPAPTPAPWAWTRDDNFDVGQLHPLGIWRIGSRIVVQLANWYAPESGYPLAIGSWTEQDGWEVNPPGAAVVWLAGGTVVDGRLWFMAGIGGVSRNDFTYQLVSTRDGREWEALGKIRGLGEIDGLAFLRRYGDVWVAGIYHTEGPCCTGGVQVVDLLWSTDGVHWNKADVPDLGGPLSELRPDVYRGALVVAVSIGSYDVHSAALLRTQDGRTWHEVSIPMRSPDDTPIGFACNADRCVLAASPLYCECDDSSATAYTWTGGDRWSSSDMGVPEVAADDIRLRALTASDGAFIAVSGVSGNAVVSSDGDSWRTLQVMPLATAQAINAMLVWDGVLYAIGESLDSTPSGLWTGSLSAMGLGGP